MPTPVPVPTADEIVTLAEIMQVSTGDATAAAASDTDQSVSNAKWFRTQSDLEAWAEIVDEAGDIKRVGVVEFFEKTIGITRLAFRNKVRQRYGLVLLTTETGSTGAIASLTWF